MTNQTKQATPMCMCGAPWTLRTVHLADNPCFVYDPVALSSATPAGGGLTNEQIVLLWQSEVGREHPDTIDKVRFARAILALAASPVPMSDTGAQEVAVHRAWCRGVNAAIASPPQDAQPFESMEQAYDQGFIHGQHSAELEASQSAPQDASDVHEACSMSVGCDEAGVCYAAAHGDPDRCPKATESGVSHGKTCHTENHTQQTTEQIEAHTAQIKGVHERMKARLASQQQSDPANNKWWFEQGKKVAQSAPQDAQPGVHDLSEVVRLLRKQGHYEDDEGEVTNRLEDLLASIRAPQDAQPLTDEQIRSIWQTTDSGDPEDDILWFARTLLSTPQASQSAPQDARCVHGVTTRIRCEDCETDQRLRPDFMAGYDAGMKDGKALMQQFPSLINDGVAKASQSAQGEAESWQEALRLARKSLTFAGCHEESESLGKCALEAIDAALATTHSAPVSGMTLSDDQINDIWAAVSPHDDGEVDMIEYARAIEAALREKAGGEG